MKSLFFLRYRLSFVFIFILAISCKKDPYLDEHNDKVYPVNFTFTNFKTSSSFLKHAAAKGHFYANASNPANHNEGKLYFWSFNNASLAPDIKYSSYANPSITYDDGKIPGVSGTGFAYEEYAAGNAANFTGPQEIFIKLPIQNVISIKSLGFDITGSATGPKDFEIYYSTDEGDSYQPIELENQFSSVAANAKSTFTYNLEDFNIAGDELWIKMVMKAGDRTGGSNYNASTGTVRIDNLYLIGIAPTAVSSFSVNKLHYFIFNEERPEANCQGILEDMDNLYLNLELLTGDYKVFFILNSSDEELLLPNSITSAADLYTSTIFSNRQAEIFGYAGSMEVNGNMTSNIVLQRLYSQIKIEFTDAFDLSHIQKIVVKQEHEPFFYSPFNSSMTNPILDQSSVEIADDFQLNKQLVFNQFMGLLSDVAPVHYSVEVYDNTGIIRTLELNSMLKNNIQLVFRGNILDDILYGIGFQITKNEDWDDENEIEF